MEENTQLPKEVVDKIEQQAHDAAWSLYSPANYNEFTSYQSGYTKGATAYAPWKVKYDELCERYKALDQAMFAMQQELLKAQPGARWVKASERLPKKCGKENSVIVKGLWHGKWPFVGYGYRNFSKDDPRMYYEVGNQSDCNNDVEWLDESAVGREDWISVDERPLIKRDGEWWELTEDGEQEFIAAVPYHDAETDDPKKDRWWIRHCYIDGEGFLYVKRDNEMDEDVAGWNVSDITHWRPLPEPPKQQKEK